MVSQRQAITQLCGVVNRQVQEAYKGLNLHYILHHSGQRAAALLIEEPELARNPAGSFTPAILKKKVESDESAFLGLAVTNEKYFLGLASRDYGLGIISVNIDQYQNGKQARLHMYHLAWHAIDMMEIRQEPEYRQKFRQGHMIPSRSPMNLAKANLRADVFAAVMCAFQGQTGAIRQLAEERSYNALATRAGHQSEDYPYIIAMEAAQFAYNEVSQTVMPKARMIRSARQIAEDVGTTFDESSIRQWWAFSEPAQDMAWRGYTREQILGAAINTSEDPFVRANGMLVGEITGIEPASAADLANIYNAYSDQEINERLHRDMADTVFEGAMAQGLSEKSGSAFINAANEQNKSMTDGKLIGWCASALQAAGKAFDQAQENGSSPSQAARMEFEGKRGDTTWDTIRKLGEKILRQKRFGYLVTFSDISELCRGNAEFAPVVDSVKITMNDPAFMHKLAAVNDLAPQAPSMSPFVPSATPKIQPTAPRVAPLAMPTFGGKSTPQAQIPPKVLQQASTETQDGDGSRV